MQVIEKVFVFLRLRSENIITEDFCNIKYYFSAFGEFFDILKILM